MASDTSCLVARAVLVETVGVISYTPKADGLEAVRRRASRIAGEGEVGLCAQEGRGAILTDQGEPMNQATTGSVKSGDHREQVHNAIRKQAIAWFRQRCVRSI